MLSLLLALVADCTKENAEWCAFALMGLAGALGVVWTFGRHTFYDGSAR